MHDKEEKQHNVVIIGGSFAGLGVLRVLRGKKNVHITLIEPKDYFEYTPGIHHILAGTANVNSIFSTKKRWIPRSVSHIRTPVVGIDHEKKTVTLADDKVVSFDYLVCTSGASYPKPVRGALSFDERKEEILSYRRRVQDSGTIALVGGGLVGVEFASELADTYPGKKIYLLDLLPAVLATLPRKAQWYAEEHLRKQGVFMRLGRKSKIEGTRISFEDGEVIEADLLIWCCGLRAQMHIPKEEHKSTKLGYIVNDKLQVIGTSNIYAAGDCVDGESVGALKTAYTAEEMGTTVGENVLLTMEGKLKKLHSYPSSLYWTPTTPTVVLVSLGKSDCIMVFNNIVLKFYPFLWFKHFIQYSKIKAIELYTWSIWLWVFAEYLTAWMHYFFDKIGLN